MRTPVKTTSKKVSFNELTKHKGLFFKNNSPFTGFATDYYSSGADKTTANLHEGKFHGFLTTYYENGKIRSKINFIDNKAQGKVTKYYEDGTVKSIEHYSFGKLNGKVFEFYPSGKLKSETKFFNDKPFDESLTYDEDGKIIGRILY